MYDLNDKDFKEISFEISIKTNAQNNYSKNQNGSMWPIFLFEVSTEIAVKTNSMDPNFL